MGGKNTGLARQVGLRVSLALCSPFIYKVGGKPFIYKGGGGKNTGLAKVGGSGSIQYRNICTP